MSGKPSSALRGIVKTSLFDERQNQVVDSRHNATHIASGHAGCIFAQGNIAAIMQTSFDAPMFATILEKLQGRGC